MRVDKELAEFIAREAVAEPYRQVDAMTTRDFARWLRARDISLSWDTLHYLWIAGVLHPIVVLEPALKDRRADSARFAEVELGYEGRTFVDLGTDVQGLPPRTTPDFSERRSDSLLWHPFQLWQFVWLTRILQVPIALDAGLGGPDQYADLARRLLQGLPEQLAEYANSERHAAFLRIVGLLLAAEPLVHTILDPKVVTRPMAGESFEEYFDWRRSYDGASILSKVGLALDDVEKWHCDISIQAQLGDPLEDWRVLLRHANRDKRKRLKGSALQADSLYDHAEVLRRYIETYHGRQLVEEDDVRHGPYSQTVKESHYGAKRTADFDRTVFRRIARDFDLDPQARTTWFVEGDTEEAFIEGLSERMGINLNGAGVEVMNLEGLGGLASHRFRELLERFQREEVFSYVSIDHDSNPDAPRQLSHYAKSDLLPAGFRVWDPDFETVNFTLDELASVATKMANDDGVSVSIAAEDIEEELATSGIPVGKAIERLLNRRRYYGGKGERWGAYLADHAAHHDCPRDLADEDGRRAAVGLLFFLLRGQTSNYKATIKHSEVAEGGGVVSRRRDQANEDGA
jgi:hypothetical protein